MVLRPPQCPTGIATPPEMLHAMASERGFSKPITRHDFFLAQPGQVFPSPVISEELLSSPSISLHDQSSLTFDLSTNDTARPFNYTEYLEGDLTLSTGTHSAINQKEIGSTTSTQTEYALSRTSFGFGPSSGSGLPRNEQVDLDRQTPKKDLCPDSHPEDISEGHLEAHTILPQGIQDPLLLSCPQLSTDPFSFPEPLCSVCFRPLHLCSFFASYQWTDQAPEENCWNDTGQDPRIPESKAYHVDTAVPGMCVDQVHSDKVIATNSRHSTTDPVLGNGATAGISGAVERLHQESEYSDISCQNVTNVLAKMIRRSYGTIPPLEYIQSPVDPGLTHSLTTSPAMTPFGSTPPPAFSKDESPNSSAKQPWQCELCNQSFKQRCRLK
ncbi:MAG: hypothetical protein M1812_007805 [Candelaria pacifica]|nr:MAG: hypothetical protein M1812_007805 [Candelaria pacifica]